MAVFSFTGAELLGIGFFLPRPSIRFRAGLPAGATLDQPNSSFANALLRLVHLGGDLADGNSVYPNVPKGLSRASQPVTSLIRGDPSPRWNTTDLALMLEFELIGVDGSYPGRQPSTWAMGGSSYLGLLL